MRAAAHGCGTLNKFDPTTRTSQERRTCVIYIHVYTCRHIYMCNGLCTEGERARERGRDRDGGQENMKRERQEARIITGAPEQA